jgi:sodium/potassium-transporting ATPase subunit alpha
MQVVNVHLCRTRQGPFRTRWLLGNRTITAGIAIELAVILLIDYTAVGQYIFGTASIPVSVWAVVLPFAAAMIVFEEVRKTIARDKPSGFLASHAKNSAVR